MFSKHNKKGFTLVELLVVLSIISLLSSIVYANISGAREKARMTSIRQFDAANYHALAADALGIWNFSGNNLDSSGNGKTLLIPSASYTTDYLNNSNSALSFNGTSNYAMTITAINLPPPSSEITVSAWVFSTNFNQNGVVVMKNPMNSRWSLLFETNLVKWRTNTSGADITCPLPTNNLWHNITAMQKGSQATLYIDGKVCGNTSSMVPVATDSTNRVEIGRYGGGSPSYYFSGKIDDVRIYASSLFASDVWQIYAEGAAEHGIALSQ